MFRFNAFLAAALCAVVVYGSAHPAAAQDRRVPAAQPSCGCPMRRWCSAPRRRSSTSMPPRWCRTAIRCSTIRSSAASSACRAMPPRAGAALARLRRDRRRRPASSSPTITSSRARPGEGLARPTSASSRPRSCSRMRAPISRCCGSRTRSEKFPALDFAQFRRAAGRRPGAGDRQSVRRRTDRDARHRFGAGAHAGRHHRLSVLHPDRCGDQSGQFRRRAGRSDAAGSSASTPRSSRAPAARRASALRFRPTWCASWSPRPRAAARR